MFVKRWVDQSAPGHALLEKIVGEKLPNTPRVFGFAMNGGDSYYFFENLSTYTLLEDVLFKHSQNKPSILSSILIGRNVGFVIASSFYDLFKRVGELGFIYPDFTHRNIMIDFSNKALPCMMIDLDSCFPKGKLADNINTAGRFSVFYWGAWRKEMPRHTVDLLLISMILSFTAVWARAIALLRTSPTPDDALKLIRNPNYQSAQASFWTALKDRNRTDIQRHFLLVDQKSGRPRLHRVEGGGRRHLVVNSPTARDDREGQTSTDRRHHLRASPHVGRRCAFSLATTRHSFAPSNFARNGVDTYRHRQPLGNLRQRDCIFLFI